jgi:hypothetical protein
LALSHREKILLLIPAGLGAILAFYTYVHEPLFTRRAEASTQTDQLQSELIQSKKLVAQEGDLRLRLSAVAAREQVVDAWVPGKNSAAMLIYQLSKAERDAGVRLRGIKVSERQEVDAVSKPEAGTDAKDGAQPTAIKLTKITLDLTTEGMFKNQLHFHQLLERMELFLNTGSFGMTRKEEPALVRISELVQQGDDRKAAQVLATPPTLDGTYQLHLYFKSDKIGHPASDGMKFQSQPGRDDPFVWDGVEEFIQTLLHYYTGGYDVGGPQPGDVRVEDGRKEQMG